MEKLKSECKYCKAPYKDLAISQTPHSETSIVVCVIGEYLRIFDDDWPGTYSSKHKINFCPMCGRKLGIDEIAE